jgi:curli biogenesis system outer membrane secretion channel CsgG
VIVRRAILALALLGGAWSAGCGYALAGRGSFLPEYIREVGIPQFENRTTFFQIEQILTEKIRAEFIGRNKYNIRPERTGADAVLTGEIVGMSVQPVGFNERQLGSRYLITMTMRVVFTDVRTGEVLWSDDALTFRSEYELSTTPTGGETFVDQERTSFDRISNDIARSVVTAILEAF